MHWRPGLRKGVRCWSRVNPSWLGTLLKFMRMCLCGLTLNFEEPRSDQRRRITFQPGQRLLQSLAAAEQFEARESIRLEISQCVWPRAKFTIFGFAIRRRIR